MLKRSLLIIMMVALFAGVSNAQSETFKPFKVDLGGLYAIPTSEDYTGGIGFYLEPKYNVTDQIAVGLKAEWAVIGAAENDGESVSISAIGTYQITGDYYFSTNKVRPFAGLGAGIYSLGTSEISSDAGNFEVDFGSKFGFAPRVGVLLGHFRLGLEYNVITGLDEGLSSRNYLALKFGFEIGGGRR